MTGNTGGGISTHGTVTIRNSTVSHNSGRGIYNVSGTLTLLNSSGHDN